MLVDPSSAAGSTVAGAIREASQATGANFNYLLATAQVESGLNPQAGASTSSARGLFQFIEQTWFATMKQAGAALGFSRYAAAITKTAAGRYEVRDPAMRQEILKLRTDSTANAVMAGAFTTANASALQERLGRSPSEGELYIAHFLGAGGAARLITLAATTPHAAAAQFFPNAAQANPSIFYDRATGAARSLEQVRNVLTARYDVARSSQDRLAPVAEGTGSTAAAARTASAVPDTAGIASAFAAAGPGPKPAEHQVFRGLFADASGSAPLAPVVNALWGVPSANNAGSQSAANTMLNLFKDSPNGGSSGGAAS
jgi:hypothetical protein